MFDGRTVEVGRGVFVTVGVLDGDRVTVAVNVDEGVNVRVGVKVNVEVGLIEDIEEDVFVG